MSVFLVYEALNSAPQVTSFIGSTLGRPLRKGTKPFVILLQPCVQHRAALCLRSSVVLHGLDEVLWHPKGLCKDMVKELSMLKTMHRLEDFAMNQVLSFDCLHAYQR